jgi:hypothetical protein
MIRHNSLHPSLSAKKSNPIGLLFLRLREIIIAAKIAVTIDRFFIKNPNS